MWFNGVEVAQETSAPPPKKKSWIRPCIEGIKSRYDTQTRDLLTKFLSTGTISHQFQPKKPSYHITCYFNETRRGVTEACCNRFTKDKYYHEIKFNYQGKTEQYKVAVGMHFLATKHGGSLCKFRK